MTDTEEFESALTRLESLVTPWTQEDIDRNTERLVREWGPDHFLTRFWLEHLATPGDDDGF